MNIRRNRAEVNNTLLLFIFAGTSFRGDRNYRISQLCICANSPLKCFKNPQTEFSKITFFAGTDFRELCQKQRNPRKSISVTINTNKV